MIDAISLEILFTIANVSAILAWVLLAVAPFAGVTRWLIHYGLYPVLLSVFYLGMIIIAPAGEGDFSSLAGVSALFADKQVLLAGWVH